MASEKISVRQVKAARALLGWTQVELADKAGIALITLRRIEAVDGPLGGRPETIEAIARAIEEAGVEFLAPNGRGAGVRLRK